MQLADVRTKDSMEREQMLSAMRGEVNVASPDEAYARKEAARASRAARAELRREARNSVRLQAAAECRARHAVQGKGRKASDYVARGRDLG